MLDGLDDVNWSRHHGSYTPAHDVPALLRALAAADGADAQRAASALFNIAYHQGTRWDVSAHVVPFLCAIVDAPKAPARAATLRALLRIALGDAWGDDATLPFEPAQVFAAAQGVVAGDYQVLIDALDADDPSEAERLDPDGRRSEQLVVAWARDACEALAARADRVLVWACDPSIEVAHLAITAIPWLSKLHERAVPLLVALLREERPLVFRAMAALTLGLLPPPLARSAIARLEQTCIPATPLLLQAASAVALAYLQGRDTPEATRGLLLGLEAFRADIDAQHGKLLYDRPMMGFRARALHRIGSGP